MILDQEISPKEIEKIEKAFAIICGDAKRKMKLNDGKVIEFFVANDLYRTLEEYDLIKPGNPNDPSDKGNV